MHPALACLDHRPWPIPDRLWAWRQTWRDLLFAHWPVEPAAVRRLVPAGLEIDVRDGVTWAGVVPFRMTGVMRRPWPDLPWISAFPELNLRLYVVRDGKPGVWFLSLDAANPLAVWAARRFFHLPYFTARMTIAESADRFRYRSDRLDRSASFAGEYGPVGRPYQAVPGSLEHWLTERYCLYAASPDCLLFRGEVHHAPWPLQPAWADLEINGVAAPHGLRLDGPPALLHFARRLDVIVWPLERLNERIGSRAPFSAGSKVVFRPV